MAKSDKEKKVESPKPKKGILSKKNKDKEKIDKLTEDLNESNDKFLRLYAEFDNFRKRTQKEKLEIIKTASKDLIVELLSVLDDFERSFQSKENEDEIEGKRLIYNKLRNTLIAKGLVEIEAQDMDFDVELHEAITQIPVEEADKKGKVMDVLEKGYMLNEHVIRYSKVVIGA